MSTRARLNLTAIVATAAFAALLCSPPVAAADGLPAVGVDARPLSAPGSEIAYVTRRAGRRTALEVIDADSERRLRRVLLPGGLTVPAVAYDATPSGITPDGRKLYFTRIEEAKRMLASRHYSVKEVAERVGFSDCHYFSRSFKELTGQSWVPVLVTDDGEVVLAIATDHPSVVARGLVLGREHRDPRRTLHHVTVGHHDPVRSDDEAGPDPLALLGRAVRRGDGDRVPVGRRRRGGLGRVALAARAGLVLQP